MEDFEKVNIENKNGNRYIFAAFWGLLIFLIGYVVLGNLEVILILGTNLKTMDPNLLKLITISNQILYILLPALLLSKKYFNDVSDALKVKIPSAKEVSIFIGGLFLMLIVMQGFVNIEAYLLETFSKTNWFVKSIKSTFDFLETNLMDNYTILKPNSIIEIVLVFITVSVIPPLCEEAFFRGFLQSCFNKKFNIFISSFLTAFFFAIIHLNFYGFIVLFSLSLYFSYAVYRSESLFTSMFLHFVNNTFSMIGLLVSGVEDSLSTKTTIKTSTDLYMSISSTFLFAVLFIILILYIEKIYKRKEVQDDMSEV